MTARRRAWTYEKMGSGENLKIDYRAGYLVEIFFRV
jgi:hypothetical protein